MDPLSISSGIIAILHLSGKIIASCSRYISAVKDAPSDLRVIMAEVASLQSLVRMLDLHLVLQVDLEDTHNPALLSLSKDWMDPCGDAKTRSRD
jgi:hypothetical protein